MISMISGKKMILILSNKYDVTVDFVIRLLRRKKIKFLRINTEDFLNMNVSLTLPEFSYTIEKNGRICNLAKELRSVWFRRPGKPFEFTPIDRRPNAAVITFVENQWHSFIEGIKHIDHVNWINDPDNVHIAENKILQLKLARHIGLKIPETCITNDKSHVSAFFNKFGGKIIAKALSCPLIESEDKDHFIFTSIIDEIEDVSEHEFGLAPTIFQEYLTGKIDYRLTIIGEHCYSVKVVRESDKGISKDWRIVKEGLKFQVCELPNDIEAKCVKIVRELGLVFGAIDLVEIDGEFYFLEINPNGEWGWLQKECDLPIAETLVDYLSNGASKAYGDEKKIY